jgi:hypothetical protein
MMWVCQMLNSIDIILFHTPDSTIHLRVRALFMAAIYVIGVAAWIAFFSHGDVGLVDYDWIKEGAYLNILRDAQVRGVIPWELSESSFFTPHFLANPETVLTPDIIMLHWISNDFFVIFHIVLFYSLGFIGSVLIAKKYNYSLTAFMVFWLLFNFNGYLTSHLAVGHFQWVGYFVLPFFFLLVFSFIQKSQSMFTLCPIPTVGMGLLLGLLFLNGSVHVAVWCSMFMVITLLWKPEILSNVVVSIFVGTLLGANRLLPAAVLFPPIRSFVSGYPSFTDLLDAFTSLHAYDFVPFGTVYNGEGWWEYDMFIGFTAFIFLSVSLIPAMRLAKMENQLPLFITAGVLLLLSLGTVYSLIVKSPLPFATIERAPSRFIIMALVLLLIYSSRILDQLLSSRSETCRIFTLIALPFAVSELREHFLLWRVKYIERSFQEITTPMLSILSNPNPNHIYVLSVYAGWLISVISLIVVVLLLLTRAAREMA